MNLTALPPHVPRAPAERRWRRWLRTARRIAARLRRRTPARNDDPRYSVTASAEGLLWITARGDQPRVTQILLEAARDLPPPVGMVLVEVHGPTREWVGEPLPRAPVLDALLGLRDLWGRGLADVAVFSPGAGTEVFLDRFGTLEIRTASWRERPFRQLLDSHGFTATGRLSTLPVPGPVEEWTEDRRERFHGFRERLGLTRPENRVPGEGSGPV